MKTNNYDRSSTGLNLELSCFLDADRSRMDFEDNLQKFNYSDLYAYTEGGQINTDFSGSAILRLFDIGSGKDLLKAFLVEYKVTLFEEIRDLLNQYNVKPSDSIENIFDLIKAEIYYSGDIWDFLSGNFDHLYDVVTVTGYCQGDREDVILLPEFWALTGLEKTKEKINNMQEYIQHLFYDAPLYCRLTVNGTEYNADDFIKDPYEYDKQEIIAGYKRLFSEYTEDEQNQILDFLENNLPDYPDCY